MLDAFVPRDVFLISTGSFLPGPPVDNDRMEAVLGPIHGEPCPLRVKVLRQNRIQGRHYALDPEGRVTHQAEDLAAEAIDACLRRSSIARDHIGMLAAASTAPDLAAPGFASMVHARSGLPACEILTTHGICCSGVMALRAAVNALRLREHDHALVCAAELVSRQFRASHYEAATAFARTPADDADAAFLRWMLSDGAGAWLLSSRPLGPGPALRVDWIRLISHAHALPTCMLAGRSGRDGAPRSWHDYPTYADAERDGAMLLRQDRRLLEHLVRLGVKGFLDLVGEDLVHPDRIDRFLCHYSSHFFRRPILRALDLAGAAIPEDRWFTNLYTRGNTGCAAIFVMLDELMREHTPDVGERILCFVPESGRFSTAFFHLTVVDPENA